MKNQVSEFETIKSEKISRRAAPDTATAGANDSHPRNVATNFLQRINSQETRVSLRVENDKTPERLQLAADARPPARATCKRRSTYDTYGSFTFRIVHMTRSAGCKAVLLYGPPQRAISMGATANPENRGPALSLASWIILMTCSGSSTMRRILLWGILGLLVYI